jgi:hypothetical protein
VFDRNIWPFLRLHPDSVGRATEWASPPTTLILVRAEGKKGIQILVISEVGVLACRESKINTDC